MILSETEDQILDGLGVKAQVYQLGSALESLDSLTRSPRGAARGRAVDYL